MAVNGQNFEIDIHYFDMVSRHEYARYLPVNKDALLWGIYCRNAGYSRILPGATYPNSPESHPRLYAETVKTGRLLREFQVVYISSGGGWFRDPINGRRSIQAGDVFIIFPGIEHSYSPNTNSGWQEYWIGFDGSQVHRLMKNKVLNPKKNIYHIGFDQDIINDYEQIIQLCRQQSPGFQIVLGAKILQLLADLHVTRNRASKSHGESSLIYSARSIMQSRVKEGIAMEQLAQELNTTYEHLLNVFRQHTGLTPYQYYLQLRVYQAQELLQNPKLAIKEIAAAMNFDNQYYFSRFFKQKTGMAPSRWRREKTAGLTFIT